MKMVAQHLAPAPHLRDLPLNLYFKNILYAVWVFCVAVGKRRIDCSLFLTATSSKQ